MLFLFLFTLMYWAVVFYHIRDTSIKMAAIAIGIFIPTGIVTLIFSLLVWFIAKIGVGKCIQLVKTFKT